MDESLSAGSAEADSESGACPTVEAAANLELLRDPGFRVFVLTACLRVLQSGRWASGVLARTQTPSSRSP